MGKKRRDRSRNGKNYYINIYVHKYIKRLYKYIKRVSFLGLCSKFGNMCMGVYIDVCAIN